VIIAICPPLSAIGLSSEFDERFDRQGARIAELETRPSAYHAVLHRLPLVEQPETAYGLTALYAADTTAAYGFGACDCPPHQAGYDKGFFIRAICPKATPFELKVNGRIQFRHTAFDRQSFSYFNRATNTLVPIEKRNDFEVERGRMTFSGFVHDPNLEFYINIDMDTDDSHRAVAQDFWFNYKLSDLVDLYVGKAFVPGSREWVDGALTMRLGDRSMSTTFFRPDRSVGIWSMGRLCEDLNYRVMVGNGVASADLAPSLIDDRLVVAGTIWWEPLADFGKGYSDLEWHDQLAVRIGASGTFTSLEAKQNGLPVGESNFVRLTDGVRLVETGALATGVTVNGFNYSLFAADVAAKYRGFSFNGEFYARWLDDFSTDGPIPFTELYDDGFYFECGYMACPGKFEIIGRISTVDGVFGDAWEYAGGVNLFKNGHNNKVTFDVTYLDGCPVTNSGVNFRRGDRGVMIRTAWQVAF
jgi:hypothetical protein